MDLQERIKQRLASESVDVPTGSVRASFVATSDKDYQTLQSYVNVTSYSMLSELHACPRKFQLIKARAAGGGKGANNVDFAYGHSVGAGIQAWLMSRDMDAAIFNAFMAWTMPYDSSIEKKHKTIWDATIAVQKYAEFHDKALGDWEVWVLPNGKPAIELSFSIDFGNGFKHYCHVDVILVNKKDGRLAIQENKTSGFKVMEEALYANSSQALSYAVLIDALSKLTSYQVFYMVYSTTNREWEMAPFSKSVKLKAEALKDIALDHANIETYEQMGFYPKRGESCFLFMRRCQFFGECNITRNLPQMKRLPADQEAERVDFSFKLSELVAAQEQRLADDSDVDVVEEAASGGGFTSID